MRLHDSHLLLADHWADVGMRIHPIAHAQLLRFRGAGCGKWFIQTAVHITALDRQTRLAGVHERSPDRSARCHVHIGVVEHQQGSLPPSSSTTGSKRSAAEAAIRLPVATLPVNTSLSIAERNS